MARILLAEDEPHQCAELRGRLETNHEVCFTVDSRTAIKHLKQALSDNQPFDVVLTDGVLSGSLGGGGDIIIAMRHNLPAYKQTPVIACSSTPGIWSALLEYRATAANLYPIAKCGGWDTEKVLAKLTELGITP